MTGYDPAQWSDFALAQLGASAALLGLVFVSLSINLREVVGSRLLVHRAAEAVIVLGSVLTSATVVLIPAQDRGALGAELVAIATATFAAVWRMQSGTRAMRPGDEERGPPKSSLVVRRVLGLGAQVLLLVAAITLAIEAGGGLYWWPAAVIAAYMSARA